MIQVLIALWLLVGSSFTWHVGLPANVHDSAPLAYGAVSCETREGWLARDAPLEVIVHEYAHAYDCIDDGVLNGSPKEQPAWLDAYCNAWEPRFPGWNCRAEWYAYDVVSTQSAR